MERVRFAVCLVVLFLLTPISFATWSTDPAVNLPVADGASDQAQPKVVPTSDGGCYISWFGGLASGYDVRLQKLDSDGNEVFAHNGILVADRSFSSTQDYGLDVDASGNALLAFRDDRLANVQITASKVSPTGTLLWGSSGIQLTNTTAYVAAPVIAGTTDGGVVVGWTQDADVHVMKLASDGSQLWGADVVFTPLNGSYSASDMHGTGTDVIISIVHIDGPYYAAKYLLAQKLDTSGISLWGPTPMNVFDTGSLQFGNYPDFITDGSGGAVFSWYDASSSTALQCYAQHILSDGSEAFPHNGSAGSINAARQRVEPHAAYNGTTGETFLFWEEEDLSQSQTGIYGQKFDASGSRQWGSSGSVIVPVGSDENTWARCLTEGTGVFVFWVQSPGYAQDVIHGARLDGSGAIDISIFDVASTTSEKWRLAAATSTLGYKILVWQDDRNGDSDVFAQNVNSDGTLGPATGVDGEAADITALGAPWPNPMSGGTHFEFSLPASSPGVLEVCNVGGQVVRRLAVSSRGQDGVVSWDGRDDRGRAVPGGVYFVRLAGGEASGTAKVTVVR
jgi:hypothetical protein